MHRYDSNANKQQASRQKDRHNLHTHDVMTMKNQTKKLASIAVD